ncbi:SpoIIIAH-like family protein [Pasteuria penetrans]|uniref:SpoIIIAH-like family protein n=1 Tax=Pasteuria penetrans TaxID=86005 RepID=UPI00165B1404|nr:SpoIIIAH-like family protein [Pasteuria penetrans]
MSMRKQTMWLISMLAMMVVLSVYYVATGPTSLTIWPNSEPSQQVDGGDEDVSNRNAKVQTLSPMMGAVKEGSDYFIGQQLQRTTLRQRKTEEAMKQIADPKATKEQVELAQQQVEQLAKLDRQENSLEEGIRKQGFSDALVLLGDPQVNIIVQSSELTKGQVVKLIQLAEKHLGVDPVHVSVTHRA